MNKLKLFTAELKSQRISRLKTVSDEFYCSIIPKEMSLSKLNRIYFEVFGLRVFDMYILRNCFEAKLITITDFASNGFFWGQMEEEKECEEFIGLHKKLNSGTVQNQGKLADLECKNRWCLAKYEDLWFRAYIDEVLENNMVKLFFLDYGTIAIVPHVDTRYNNEEEVWYIQPLAIPFFLKGLNLTKLKDFKNMQYCMFEIMTLKLIENNVVFEVELKDKETGKLLVEIF